MGWFVGRERNAWGMERESKAQVANATNVITLGPELYQPTPNIRVESILAAAVAGICIDCNQ